MLLKNVTKIALKTLKETILDSKKKESHVDNLDRSQNNTAMPDNSFGLNSADKVTKFRYLISDKNN